MHESCAVFILSFVPFLSVPFLLVPFSSSPPKGGWGCLKCSPLSGISVLLFDFSTISSCFSLYSCFFFYGWGGGGGWGLFCLLAHSADFFPQKMHQFFFFVNNQEMIVGRWNVQHAAVWYWYLPLCTCTLFFNSLRLPILFWLRKMWV